MSDNELCPHGVTTHLGNDCPACMNSGEIETVTIGNTRFDVVDGYLVRAGEPFGKHPQCPHGRFPNGVSPCLACRGDYYAALATARGCVYQSSVNYGDFVRGRGYGTVHTIARADGRIFEIMETPHDYLYGPRDGREPFLFVNEITHVGEGDGDNVAPFIPVGTKVWHSCAVGGFLRFADALARVCDWQPLPGSAAAAIRVRAEYERIYGTRVEDDDAAEIPF